MAFILSIETSTAVCSVALSENSIITALKETDAGFSHAEKLTLFISDILNESGKTLHDLDAIAVSGGPGSYTGLRIGVSVAKGLCYALDKPLINIPTLDAMASGAIANIFESDNCLYCPMIDARRMEVYTALFTHELQCLNPVEAVIVDENFLAEEGRNKKIFLFGDGSGKCREILSNRSEFIFQEEKFISAKHLSGPAYKKYEEKSFENLALFEPFYLKEFRPGPKS